MFGCSAPIACDRGRYIEHTFLFDHQLKLSTAFLRGEGAVNDSVTDNRRVL